MDSPASSFDLVSSQYMHLPSPDMRALVTALAASVRPGGTLLVVGHADSEHRGVPDGAPSHGAAVHGAAVHGVAARGAGAHGFGAHGGNSHGGAHGGGSHNGDAGGGSHDGDADGDSHDGDAGHGAVFADGERPAFDPDLFFTAEALVDLLSPTDWDVVAAESRPHPTRPGSDAVLHARRR
ncbi:hypothetical protein GCM10025867_25220 [Frondihabitans sucicola]|uniref:Class I SAM-dependent methyltransferase n=1 Tax=Frondihabitans sucicola TaxID=1268041 RepID=A0ABN6Y2U5_9MICO|nr:hypothetical protein [Frondihabitans sucicola]BDZ50281.1 hypothetical protein GCM10025867_25220 [Frondihabitans sucicola]